MSATSRILPVIASCDGCGACCRIVTSPPFALLHEKEYGNRSQDEYVAWFQDFADEFWRVLAPHGSLVIDLGSAWEPKSPTKSLYAFELLISLCRRPRRRAGGITGSGAIGL